MISIVFRNELAIKYELMRMCPPYLSASRCVYRKLSDEQFITIQYNRNGVIVMEDRGRIENLVGVVDVVFGEVGGAPARDGVADVLRGADDGREDDEEQHRVAVVQPVN